MKKIVYICFLILGITAFTSCDDAGKDATVQILEAPEITSPTSFTQYTLTQETANNPIDVFFWTSADFGFPAAVVYTLQVDELDGTFESPVNLGISTTSNIRIYVGDLNNAAIRFIPEGETGFISIRIKATVDPNVESVYSKPIALEVTTAVSDVKATKSMLYIVGNVFPSPYDWKNDKDQVGLGLQPMYSDNSTVGDGNYTYTGYFLGNNMKLVVTPGSWDKQYGYGGAAGKLEEGGGDIPFGSPDGWYKFDVNLGDMTYSITPIAAPSPTPYTRMGVIGDATENGWDADIEMTQVPFNEHLWRLGSANLLGGKSAKIRANGEWTNSWGSKGFPFGKGNNDNDDNIPILNDGDYCVMFNDITGEYVFCRK